MDSEYFTPYLSERFSLRCDNSSTAKNYINLFKAEIISKDELMGKLVTPAGNLQQYLSATDVAAAYELGLINRNQVRNYFGFPEQKKGKNES